MVKVGSYCLAYEVFLTLQGYGEVDENGPDTSGNYKKGDRVVAVPWPGRETGKGTWQQYVAVPEKNLVSFKHFAAVKILCSQDKLLLGSLEKCLKKPSLSTVV